MEKKKSLYTMFSKWSLSYLLISLLAIAVIFFCARRYSQELRDSLEYTNAVNLETTQLRLDQRVRNLRAFANKASLNKTVNALRQTEEVSTYMLYDLVQELSEELVLTDENGSTYLYFPVRDIMMSGSYYGSSRMYYDSRLYSYGFAYEDWYEIISKDYKTSQVFSVNTDSGKKLTVLIKPLDASNRRASPANTIMILDTDDLFRASTWLNQAKDAMCIVDQTNRRLVSGSALDEELEEKILEFVLANKEGGYGQERLLVDKTVVSCIRSAYENWDYVVISWEQEDLIRLSELQRIVTFLIIVYLFVSVVIFGSAIISHYRPLKNVVDILEQSDGAEMNDWRNKDAYEYISRSVSKLVDKNRENTDVIDRQRNAIIRELLHRLLTEKNAYESVSTNLLIQYGIRVDRRFFCILAYRWEALEKTAYPPHLSQEEKPEELFWFILQNVTEENLAGEGLEDICHRENDREQLFLICSDMEEEKLVEAVRRVSRISSEFVQKYLKLSHRIAVSEIHQSAGEICQAYREVGRVFDYQTSGERAEIVSYGEINLLPTDTLLQYPIDAENRLAQSVSDGDSERACGEIRAIIKRNRLESQPPEAAQFLISNIAATVIRIAGKRLRSNMVTGYQKELMDVCRQADVKRMQEELERFAGTVCREIAEQNAAEKGNQKDRLYRETKEWIDANYSDAALSVNSLSEQFGVQPAYLSKLFKDACGEKISNYIQNVRLNCAKKLLTEGMKIDEVAIRCGFGSQRTFLRLFKQYEGVTPTQFKELLQKKGREE